jgi:hypothetical protein
VIGDLLVRQAHHVAQHDRGPIVLREAPERVLEVVGQRLGASCSSAPIDGGATRSNSSGIVSCGRCFRRRMSSRNALVAMRLNQPSSEPGL